MNKKLKINVLYFASVREALGKSKEEVEVEEGISIKGILEILMRKNEKAKDLLSFENLTKRIFIAYNARIISKEEIENIILKEGDTIAVMPIISGG